MPTNTIANLKFYYWAPLTKLSQLCDISCDDDCCDCCEDCFEDETNKDDKYLDSKVNQIISKNNDVEDDIEDEEEFEEALEDFDPEVCAGCEEYFDCLRTFGTDFENLKTKEIAKLLVKKVIFSNKTTVVFFNDGTKEVIRCSEEDQFSKEMGIALAIIKKFFGIGSRYMSVLSYLADTAEDEDAKKLIREEKEIIKKVKNDKDNRDYFKYSDSNKNNSRRK